MSGRRLVSALEEIARAVSAPDSSKTAPAVDTAIAEVRAARATAPAQASEPLGRLESELGVWRSKLGVILKEPAGRQGMVKHANHWIGELGKIQWTN